MRKTLLCGVICGALALAIARHADAQIKFDAPAYQALADVKGNCHFRMS